MKRCVLWVSVVAIGHFALTAMLLHMSADAIAPPPVPGAFERDMEVAQPNHFLVWLRLVAIVLSFPIGCFLSGPIISGVPSYSVLFSNSVFWSGSIYILFITRMDG